MQPIEELSRLTPERETILTIGVFDGVHRGHQHLIAELNKKVSHRGLLSGVVTFYRHPQEVLSPGTKLTFLTSFAERTKLIKNLGIDLIAPLSFTAQLSQLSARNFVSLLQEHLKMKGLVVGPDFALGRGREGNIPKLESLGQELGFDVTPVPYLLIEGQVVSSTNIRKALTQGDMSKVAQLLGRYFSLTGVVVPGVVRGQSLGFPTANIALEPRQALPPDGVYITWAWVDGKAHRAVTNIGVRPTFGSGQRTVEVHIIDFQEDLYGRKLTIELVERVRDEFHFTTAAELKMQISKDVEQAKAVLK
jgi:riboflavin kinase/FMN adenylyltransferase